MTANCWWTGLAVVLAGAALAAQEPANTDTAQEQLARFFAAAPEQRAAFAFDPSLDAELRTVEGDARLRKLAFAAWRDVEQPALRVDHEQKLVRAGDKQSAFTRKQVGEKPAGGWGLVIAMHGGGGTAKAVNDGQWQHMQIYYKDHPEAGGYLYCALRAPTDEWNGFYTDYFYPLLEKLIRQFVVCDDVDPDRVIALGYSHGGYGAFAIGPKLPHRFAAVHASASAPTDGETSPVGLHTLPFSFMVGGNDTAHGRRERCEKFDALLTELKKQHAGCYPSTFTLVEGNGHTGLPDRDLLALLVPKVRTPLPRELWWELTDTVVRHHYWLHVPAPRKQLRVEAKLAGQRLSVRWCDGAARAEARADKVDGEVWLDARLCDLTQPLEVTLDVVTSEDVLIEGSPSIHIDPGYETRTRTLEPAPSLRTLCNTLLERGDPQLAASWTVELR